MPIEGSAGTLDIENATLRSNAIAVLTNLVTGNDVIRSSNPPALEVYGDPSHGGNEARLELVSNTATVSSKAFTRLTSNAGVLSVKTGTDASDNGTITFGGFANERLRITSDGKVAVGTTNPNTKFTLYGDDTQDEGGLLMKVVNRVAFDNGFTGIGLGGYATTSAPIIQVAKSAIIHERTGYNGTGNLMFCNDDTTDNNDVSNTHARMTITGAGNVGIGTTNPGAKMDVQGSALITGSTYGIKSTGTLGSDKSEGWYRLLIGGIRSGASAIRTECKLQLQASGLHQSLTFDFNHMISLSQTSGNSFNLLGNDHYISRVGITKLRLADAGSNQFALDMYIDHDVVPVDRDWTITLYTEGGSLISEATTFLEKITATPSASIELDTDTSIFGIVGSTTSKTLIMHENGNIGIGITNPPENLTVQDSGIEPTFGLRRKTYNDYAVYMKNTTGNFITVTTSDDTVLNVGKGSGSNRSINALGTINASGTDYAEYMKKSRSDLVIKKGDIVGINNVGELTNVFSESIQFVVKSTNPSYVGGDSWKQGAINTPKYPSVLLRVDEYSNISSQDANLYSYWEEQNLYANTEQLNVYYEENEKYLEDKNIHRDPYDRIAYCGQVPVNIYDAQPGQYVIPKQTEDDRISCELTITPTFDQYKLSIGKVIKIQEDGRAFVIVKIS